MHMQSIQRKRNGTDLLINYRGSKKKKHKRRVQCPRAQGMHCERMLERLSQRDKDQLAQKV